MTGTAIAVAVVAGLAFAVVASGRRGERDRLEKLEKDILAGAITRVL